MCGTGGQRPPLSFPACAVQGDELEFAKRNGNYSNQSCFCGWTTDRQFAGRRRGQVAQGSGS